MKEKLLDFEFVCDLLDMTPKNTWNKVKTGKLNYLKIKNFYISKDMNNGVKSQSREWEKITANHISDKKLNSIIYQELLQLNDK